MTPSFWGFFVAWPQDPNEYAYPPPTELLNFFIWWTLTKKEPFRTVKCEDLCFSSSLLTSMNVADGEAKRLEKTSKQDNGTKKLVGIEFFT